MNEYTIILRGRGVGSFTFGTDKYTMDSIEKAFDRVLSMLDEDDTIGLVGLRLEREAQKS